MGLRAEPGKQSHEVRRAQEFARSSAQEDGKRKKGGLQDPVADLQGSCVNGAQVKARRCGQKEASHRAAYAEVSAK